MKSPLSSSALAAIIALSAVTTVPVRSAAHSEPDPAEALGSPVVFQAAGPNTASIQASVDQFRLALGGINNGNVAGPLPDGRREINWDGGGSTATSIAGTPFTGFLVTRGAEFTTPGTGFIQAPPSGLAATFANAAYETIFQPFSPVRLFSPIGSRITNVRFFVPGGGGITATTTGFGAIFTDVDQPDRNLSKRASTLIEFFDADGKRLYSSVIPASPGNASVSFIAVLFPDARIARVRITSGSVALGPESDDVHDTVVMDDFIFGEPRIGS